LPEQSKLGRGKETRWNIAALLPALIGDLDP